MTEIYLHFLFAHYGLYGNAPAIPGRLTLCWYGLTRVLNLLLLLQGGAGRPVTPESFKLHKTASVGNTRPGLPQRLIIGGSRLNGSESDNSILGSLAENTESGKGEEGRGTPTDSRSSSVSDGNWAIPLPCL